MGQQGVPLSLVSDSEHQQLPAYLHNERLVSDWLRHHSSWAEGTVRVRRAGIREFARWIDPLPLILATEDDCLAWKDSLTIGPEALNNKIATLHSFYGYLLLRRLREDDPSALIKPPKRLRYEDGEPDPVHEDELEKLLRYIRHDYETLAWVLLMAYSAFRASDVAWLTVAGISERADGGGWARVVGKGGRPREVPIPAETMAVLRPFLGGAGPVFTRATGEPYKPEHISKRISGLFAELKIPRRPHGLRHRCASQLADAGTDLRVIQQILGHRDIATTMIYCRVKKRSGAADIDALAAKTDERRQRKQKMRGASE
jgi:site-specific recombinase XerD